MSELALKLIKEAKEKRLTRLDLGNCGLTELPDELFELVWLEELFLEKSRKLEVIKKDNSFNDSFKNISKLQNLKILSIIGYSQLTDLSPLKDLVALEQLYISSAHFIVDALPLSGLKKLTQLQLQKFKDLEDISQLKDLKMLMRLDISHSKVSDLSSLNNLYDLEEFKAYETQINDIASLKNMIKLKDVILYNTQVSDLSPLADMKNLKELVLHNTQVSDLSPLADMKNLKELVLHNTQVSDLSPLADMKNLKELVLHNTKVSDLSPLADMKNLKELALHNTQVSDLSPLKEIIKKGLQVNWSTYGSGILVQDCPLTNPPRYIVIEGHDAILRHWQELESKDNDINNQTKLIFIGNSRAGKTSLWQFLKDKIYNDQADSTHGIKTEIWDTETLGTEDNQNLAAHIWDFGGQEYYHATHRLFLGDNAVYVLVWERDSYKQGTRLEKFKLDDDPNGEIEEVELEHFPASYWLENIGYFAGKHCSVLIVQNKVDDEALKANYTEGVSETSDCFHLSVQNAFGFQEGNLTLRRHDLRFQDFKERLLELLRKNATSFPLVKYYGEVRKRLETLAKQNEYLTINELEKIAYEEDETKTPDLENLLAYLKSFTNTVLYFPQNEVLKDRLYLNPTHISRDIYKILNKQVRENNGKFDVAHIKTRLNLTDDQEAERFVALMREFDLIFEKTKTVKGETKRLFVTPQYLPKKEDLSDDIQFLIEGYSFETAFTVQFKSFVPRSLMLRFIAENGALSNQETYWRNGIIYKSPITPSMIKVEYDHDQSTFTIQVQDKQKQTIDMQNIIEQFVKLENSDDNIKISNDGKLYVDLRTIRKLQHEKRGGDIYENGELIPLSKFDWLIQKIKERMTLEQLKETVHNHIGKAKTKEAMDVIATWAHANNQAQLKSDINGLKGQLATLNRQQTLGMMDFSSFSIESAKLNNQLMNLLNDIEASTTEPIQEETIREPVSNAGTFSRPIVSEKLKILMLTANPTNTAKLNLDKEHSQITIKFQNQQEKFNLILRRAVSASEFKEFTETENPAILHFSGHGEGGKGGGIYVQNEDKNEESLIHTYGLDALFEYFKDQKLALDAVILNACYSEEQAQAIATHVTYVVGTTVEIGDELAIAFSTGFYFKLAKSNFDFEQAFKSGRTQAAMKGALKPYFVLYKNGEKLAI